MDFSWKVESDTCGGDHFPISLENDGPRVQRWKLTEDNWDHLQHLWLCGALDCSNQPWQTLVLSCLCLLPSWNFKLINTSFLTGRMNGTMWQQTNFILWNQPWEICSPIDSQDRTRLSSVVPILVIHSWHIVLFGVREIAQLVRAQGMWPWGQGYKSQSLL